MTLPLTLVAYMAIITWLLLLAASLIRAHGWTPAGMALAMGNRENMPEFTGFTGRADRTARNTLENFVLFAAIVLVAHVAGISSPRVAAGAQLFFWTRLLFIPIYYVGIPYLRTVVWGAGIVGLGMMLSAML